MKQQLVRGPLSLVLNPQTQETNKPYATSNPEIAIRVLHVEIHEKELDP